VEAGGMGVIARGSSVVRVNAAGRSTPLSDVWRYRGMLRSLVVRNLKVKYQRSALGFVWTFLNPLLTVGILAAVFSRVVRIPIPHYWAFLVSGYFTWNFTQQMLSTGTYVIAEHTGLRRSVAFPNEVLVLSAAVSRLLEFAIELAFVLLALVLLHHHGVPASFALLPLLVVLQVVLAVGLVMPIATVSVFYSDVQHALPIALMMLFYVSPVFYPAALVPAGLQGLYFLNPLAGLLTLFHVVLYEGRFPAPALLAGTGAGAAVLFALGYVVFNRYKALFAEVV
jgi:lipopolysaccharide transport system permease protein